MSDCCGNPGVGPALKLKDEPVYFSYNPGEVRLYGRPALSEPGTEAGGEPFEKLIKEAIDKTPDLRGDKSAFINPIKDILERLLEAIFKERYITLTVHDGLKVAKLPIDINYSAKKTKNLKSIGVIYGYAYEGHCYKLPKPQIMFLPDGPKKIEKADCGCDCGYDAKLGYALWQIDKFEHVVALDVRSDYLKTLVLDENLPGSRSPQAYAQSMLLAPQRQHD